jgi:hypothetical protein
MTDLLGAVVEALRHTTPGAEPSAVLMGNAMRILGGDWSPFDTIHPTLKDWVTKELNGDNSSAAVSALGATMAAKAYDELVGSEAAMTLLATHAADDSDILGMLKANLEKHLPAALALCVSHDAATAGLFSTALKNVTIEMAGEAFEALGKQLAAGPAGVQPFMAQVSSVASQQVMKSHPQHAQAAMFGLPMLLNMLSQFHGIYKTNHGL